METLTTNLANVEAAFTSFNGTIKSIKLAIVPRLTPYPHSFYVSKLQITFLIIFKLSYWLIGSIGVQ